jgi:hypothetical protein
LSREVPVLDPGFWFVETTQLRNGLAAAAERTVRSRTPATLERKTERPLGAAPWLGSNMSPPESSSEKHDHTGPDADPDVNDRTDTKPESKVLNAAANRLLGMIRVMTRCREEPIRCCLNKTENLIDTLGS